MAIERLQFGRPSIELSFESIIIPLQLVPLCQLPFSAGSCHSASPLEIWMWQNVCGPAEIWAQLESKKTRIILYFRVIWISIVQNKQLVYVCFYLRPSEPEELGPCHEAKWNDSSRFYFLGESFFKAAQKKIRLSRCRDFWVKRCLYERHFFIEVRNILEIAWALSFAIII